MEIGFGTPTQRIQGSHKHKAYAQNLHVEATYFNLKATPAFFNFFPAGRESVGPLAVCGKIH